MTVMGLSMMGVPPIYEPKLSDLKLGRLFWAARTLILTLVWPTQGQTKTAMKSQLEILN